MKKILFKDRYGLTETVLEKRKTMTRRGIKWDMLCDMREDSIDFVVSEKVLLDGRQVFIAYDVAGNPIGQAVSAYHIGEEVAVAQSYKSVVEQDPGNDYGNYYVKQFRYTPGWTNKMFVRADLMPHRIRITNIRMERLQDISDEDAMREGVFKYEKPPLHHEADMFAPWAPYVKPYKWNSDNLIYRCTARAAFAALIDKVSGRGTWERNPWVFVYEFELVK